MPAVCLHDTSCRLCREPLESALRLAPIPIADAYIPADQGPRPQAYYPLELGLCPVCGGFQLLDFVDPDILYGDFRYTTESSPGLVEHFRVYARHILERLDVRAGSLAVDIGSNDGTLLRFLKESGLRVVGVDPAREPAQRALAAGVDTRIAYFDEATSRSIREDSGRATIITANNTIANLADPGATFDAIRDLLAEDGVVVLEVNYLLDLFESMVFDNFYHEHYYYYSMRPLERFFGARGLEVFDVERVSTKGGSLRCYVQHRGGPRTVTGAVEALRELEARSGLHEIGTWREFGRKVKKMGEDLRTLLDRLVREGRSVAGYCASHSVTTVLHEFEIARYIPYLVDDNLAKQGTLSPGLHIPVERPGALLERKPDYVVILAWRFAENIIERQAEFRSRGGKFIVPIPELRVVD